MTPETASARARTVDRDAWLAGAAGGLVAGIVTGLVLQLGFAPQVLSRGVPAMLGLSGLAAGWVLYLLVSVAFGLGYAAVVAVGRLAEHAANPGRAGAVGLAYGAVLWVVAAVVVVPLWLQAVGFPDAPAFPFVSVRALLGYLLFGVIVGVAYPLMAGGNR